MEAMILIAIGIVVGLIVVRQAFSRPTRETIVIVPAEPVEPAPEGLGCLPWIVVGLLILLVMSSGRL
jgi:hypothetical protein